MADEDINNTEVFVYTEGVEVPEEVVRVRVHPSVTAISDRAFNGRYKLEEVELCEGLLEVGEAAFNSCIFLKRIKIPSTVTAIKRCTFQFCERLTEVELHDGLQEIGKSSFFLCRALKYINIPSTVVRIDERAFECTAVSTQLPDSIEDIGRRAFSDNKAITNFRIPPLISSMSAEVLTECESLFSLELPESIRHMGMRPLSHCKSLRNIALPYDVSVLGRGIRGPFRSCADLNKLFNTDNQMINALQHRFDNLPIHKMLYYQSYNNITPDQLNSTLDMISGQRRSARIKSDQTGNKQDCLGMTPLHILACSTLQNLEMYRVLVAKHPDNLITEDRWGVIPLLYVVWRKAPSEIVHYLVESYTSFYPNHEFHWTEMMATLSKGKVSNSVIRTLLDIQQEFIPDLDWEEWIGELTEHEHISQKTFRFLVQCGLTERVNAIGVKQFRNEIIGLMKLGGSKEIWLDSVRSKLVNYEDEYNRLKEATTMLELALWKYKMEESESNKKRKWTEESGSDFREQCRVSCRADIVIEHVLPFLKPDDSDDSDSEAADDSDSE